MRRATFFAWLLAQADRDDPVGDVARDARVDPDFPRAPREAEGYMERRGSDAAQRALGRAIREWRESKA